jgi:phenylalanine-4-hydroxylase
MKPTLHAGGPSGLVELDPDHPGFRDSVYRQRRNEIARIAFDYQTGDPVPLAPYAPEEHAVWATIWEALAPLHQAYAAAEILELQGFLPLGTEQIPQLSELNEQLENTAGFRMEPVAGLVTARTFMRYLGSRVFLSTQYIRHHSKPFYTPEPDVVHELVGHAATLVHPGIAEVNRLLGLAAEVANESEMVRVGNVYWYTMEFGLVQQNDDVKAYGAGLLSSVGEIRGYDTHARLHPFNLDQIAQTGFDPTTYQTDLFVAESFTKMLVDVSRWVRNGDWRD